MNDTTPRHIEIELSQINREEAFMLYATFCGDLERTAHACNVSTVTLLRMADEERWNDKLASIIALKKSGKPGDVERAVNRALNFVQAHRMRLFVERIINRVTGMSVDEFEDYLMTDNVTAAGVRTRRLSTRAIADLSSAMEKAQSMSYMALNDTVQERAKRKEVDDTDGSAGSIHEQIAKAMSEVAASTSPRAMLFDAQLATANEVSPMIAKPDTSPYEGDEN
jgi:hypothetical protein